VNWISFVELSFQLSAILGLLRLPVSAAERPVGAFGGTAKRQGVHHVHLFVARM